MKKTISFFVLSFILFSLFGCKEDNPPQYRNDNTKKSFNDSRIDSFDLTYKFPFINEDLQIYLHAVPEDSRCPNGVYCFWEGRAVMNLKMSYKNGNYVFNNLSVPGLAFPPPPDTLQFYNYLIIVNNLEPYPEYGTILDTLDYIVKLKITKLN